MQWWGDLGWGMQCQFGPQMDDRSWEQHLRHASDPWPIQRWPEGHHRPSVCALPRGECLTDTWSILCQKQITMTWLLLPVLPAPQYMRRQCALIDLSGAAYRQAHIKEFCQQLWAPALDANSSDCIDLDIYSRLNLNHMHRKKSCYWKTCLSSLHQF